MIVTYDINTDSADGSKRLRRIAKICQNHGQRVQKSVFECLVTPAEFVHFKNQVLDTINNEFDSVRFYLMGKRTSGKIESYGLKLAYDLEGPIIL